MSRTTTLRLALIGAATLGTLGLLLSLANGGGQPSAGPHLAAPPPLRPSTVVNEPIRPVPEPVGLDPATVALGRRLFHEPRLSGDGRVACATCHPLNGGGPGADGLARSVGVDDAIGVVNAPTVLNSAFNFRQFWDGRADSLESQIDGPVHDPVEMASSWAAIVGELRADDSYRRAFDDLYPDGVKPHNIRHAIATFERSLVTPNARFDRYLLGDGTALSEDERAGYALFKSLGCTACHQGVGVGGNMFQKMGLLGDYFADRGGGVTRADLGRYNVTGREEDRHTFKVPSLRNVALTAPYFHDGSAETLEAAVQVMARYQLGRSITPEQTDLVVKFLHTLTGDRDGLEP